VAARSKAWVGGRSLAGIVVSNPAGGMDVCLVSIVCCQVERSLRRADHLSREVRPSVMRLAECDHEFLTIRGPWPTGSCCVMLKKLSEN
jgi:hypothetical protein